MVTRSTVVLRLDGDPTQRGHAHGEQARSLVAECAQRWHDDVAHVTGMHPLEFERILVEDTGFMQTSRHHCPDLVAEIEATAAASGVALRTVIALNLLDEDWWMRTRVAAAREEHHCSGFGIAPADGQPAIYGQNMDLPPWLDGLQVLLDIRPSDGPRILAPSYPGMVATNAFNEHGVGTCQNTIAQLAPRTDGVPVALVIRMLAQQHSLAAAADLVRSVPHASGQNYLMGDATGIIDLEAGGEGVTEYSPGPRVTHTNHPLATDSGDADSTVEASSGNTALRLRAISEGIDALPVVDLAGARELLARRPLCRGGEGDGGFTFYSVVMCPGTDPHLYLTAGPPDEHDYVRYDFRD